MSARMKVLAAGDDSPSRRTAVARIELRFSGAERGKELFYGILIGFLAESPFGFSGILR